jgi:hypothetical protein
MATYEIVTSGAAGARAVLVSDLPSMEVGATVFHDGRLWQVTRIAPAERPGADGRLLLTPETDSPGR